MPSDARHESYWIATSPTTSYAALTSDVAVDVAVVGAGIVGITTAFLLTQAGRRVALLEADEVVAGVTGHTTAKVTSLHGLIYADLLESRGEERARLYGEANEAGLAMIMRLAEDRQLECELEEATAYTFATTTDERSSVEHEASTAASLGLPATFVDEPPLPFRTEGAVAFSRQARFHPRKYLLPLVAAVARSGLVHQHTRVVSVKGGSPCEIRTESGRLVTADDVVVATHAPIVNDALLVARASAHRGYAIAIAAGEWVPDGMFINAESSRSVRGARMGEREVLIVSGEGHMVGEGERSSEAWEVLERWAQEELGAGDALFRWSTQDYYPLDRVPFVGALEKHVYTATGFGGWGMTGGTAAALLLSDLVAGRESPWEDLFDPRRLQLSTVPALVRKGLHDATAFVGARFSRVPESKTLDELAPGDARIVHLDGGRVAAHRDETGELHVVSATCTHLGCLVAWNEAEGSWDCPCHGSRFDVDGAVLNGPATAPLKDRRDALAPPEAEATSPPRHPVRR